MTPPPWLRLVFARLVLAEADAAPVEARRALLSLASRAVKDARATERDYVAAGEWLRGGG